MTTLRGLNVVITRPEAQAQTWQQQLEALGATTFLMPVMQIASLTGADEVEKINFVADNLTRYQKIIFVSQNAVAEARRHFGQLFSQQPSAVTVFAIGSATATALRAWGLRVRQNDEAMNSETLLQLSELQAPAGENILICRGLGGRETLAAELRRRGASVDYCELYQRLPHPQAAMHLARLPWGSDNQHRNKVVSAHSGDSVQLLSALLDNGGATARKMKTWPLLVPGERVKKLAVEAGFIHPITAANASATAMTQTLVQWWTQRRSDSERQG